MKFLADEDFPKPLTKRIRTLGHSVKTIQELNLQGASDNTVANIARREKRILITFDNDFSASEFESLKIIIFKFPKTPTVEILAQVQSFLANLENHPAKTRLQFSKKGLEVLV